MEKEKSAPRPGPTRALVTAQDSPKTPGRFDARMVGRRPGEPTVNVAKFLKVRIRRYAPKIIGVCAVCAGALVQSEAPSTSARGVPTEPDGYLVPR
jgi:hypothetical protein